MAIVPLRLRTAGSMTSSLVNTRHPEAASGFTLVEVLLALAVSSIIGAAVVMMLAGVASATKDKNNTRRMLVGRQVIVERLNALIRGAAGILSGDEHHLMLWAGDFDRNASPNLSELRLLSWNSKASEIRLYEAATDLDPAADTVFDPGSEFSAIAQSVAESDDMSGMPIITGVDGWDLALDHADVQKARVIRLQLVLDRPSGRRTVTVVSALQATIP